MSTNDTPPHVQKVLDRHYRLMTPAEKARAVAEAWTVAHTLQSAALRAERPDLGASELEDILAARRLGAELFTRAVQARAAAAAATP